MRTAGRTAVSTFDINEGQQAGQSKIGMGISLDDVTIQVSGGEFITITAEGSIPLMFPWAATLLGGNMNGEVPLERSTTYYWEPQLAEDPKEGKLWKDYSIGWHNFQVNDCTIWQYRNTGPRCQ